jgi:hypothetical protein
VHRSGRQKTGRPPGARLSRRTGCLPRRGNDEFRKGPARHCSLFRIYHLVRARRQPAIPIPRSRHRAVSDPLLSEREECAKN